MNAMTAVRSHKIEIELAADAGEVFKMLYTPSAVREWWSAARVIVVPQTGGAWTAAWGEREDDPEYVTAATIELFDPPRELVLSDYKYYAKTGSLPFKAEFTTRFLIEPNGDGCRLIVVQDGFPCGAEADEFYKACEIGWSRTLASLKDFAEKK